MHNIHSLRTHRIYISSSVPIDIIHTNRKKKGGDFFFFAMATVQIDCSLHIHPNAMDNAMDNRSNYMDFREKGAELYKGAKRLPPDMEIPGGNGTLASAIARISLYPSPGPAKKLKSCPSVPVPVPHQRYSTRTLGTRNVRKRKLESARNEEAKERWKRKVVESVGVAPERRQGPEAEEEVIEKGRERLKPDSGKEEAGRDLQDKVDDNLLHEYLASKSGAYRELASQDSNLTQKVRLVLRDLGYVYPTCGQSDGGCMSYIS